MPTSHRCSTVKEKTSRLWLRKNWSIYLCDLVILTGDKRPLSGFGFPITRCTDHPIESMLPTSNICWLGLRYLQPGPECVYVWQNKFIP